MTRMNTNKCKVACRSCGFPVLHPLFYPKWLKQQKATEKKAENSEKETENEPESAERESQNVLTDKEESEKEKPEIKKFLGISYCSMTLINKSDE